MFKKVLLAGALIANSLTSAYANEEFYSVITVYECTVVAGNRVLHPNDATSVPFKERIEKEPTCQKMETFFVRNKRSPKTLLRTYEGTNEEDVVVIIQETSFSLPASDIRA